MRTHFLNLFLGKQRIQRLLNNVQIKKKWKQPWKKTSSGKYYYKIKTIKVTTKELFYQCSQSVLPKNNDAQTLRNSSWLIWYYGMLEFYFLGYWLLIKKKLKVALEILIKKKLSNHVKKYIILNVDIIAKNIRFNPTIFFRIKKSLIKHKIYLNEI